jgi:hypothetical protein
MASRNAKTFYGVLRGQSRIQRGSAHAGAKGEVKYFERPNFNQGGKVTKFLATPKGKEFERGEVSQGQKVIKLDAIVKTEFLKFG